MHRCRVDEHAGHNWKNLEEFKELCSCYGADFFQEKVYWEEKKIHKETEGREQEEWEEGGFVEEGHW